MYAVKANDVYLASIKLRANDTNLLKTAARLKNGERVAAKTNCKKNEKALTRATMAKKTFNLMICMLQLMPERK